MNDRMEELEERLAQLEGKVDRILSHLGLNYGSETSDLANEIRGLLQMKKKLEAIKLYRTKTGASLQEATQAVDRIGNDLGGRF